MAKTLLSNGSANKPQQKGDSFLRVHAATVAMQCFGKHVSIIEAVYSGIIEGAWNGKGMYQTQENYKCK
jgi:hypothetical protein